MFAPCPPYGVPFKLRLHPGSTFLPTMMKKGTGSCPGHTDQHLLMESLSGLKPFLLLEKEYLSNVSLFHSFCFFFCTTPSRAAKPLPLPALYVWERCWLRGEVAKSHVTHWQVGESGLVGPRHPDPGYSVDFPVPSAWVQSLLMGQPWGVSAMAR